MIRNRNRIVMIKNNGEVKIFKNQSMVAKQIGKTPGSVNHYLRGRAISKDFVFYCILLHTSI